MDGRIENLLPVAGLLAFLGCGCGTGALESATLAPQDPGSPILGDWGCFQREAEPVDSTATVTSFTVHFVQAYTLEPPTPGLVAKVCATMDEPCDEPVASAALDEDGGAILTAPSGPFYVEVSGAQMTTNLVFVGQLPSNGTLEAIVFTPSALALTESLVGLQVDPREAVVVLQARDCSDAPADGVTMAVGPADLGTTIAYFEGGGAALSTRTQATDTTGIAIAFGVPAGRFDVTAMGGAGVDIVTTAFARTGTVVTVTLSPRR